MSAGLDLLNTYLQHRRSAMNPMMSGLVLAIIITAPIGGYYLVAYLIRLLAEHNLFFTLVKEGTAKAVMVNEKFSSCVMAYSGHAFAGGTDGVECWAVVPAPAGLVEKWMPPLLKGVRWIGVPPFSKIFEYRFAWASLEEMASTDPTQLVKKPDFKKETVSLILVREDVYVTSIEGAECGDNIPLNAQILIGGHIVNPYKALFKIQHWLEATENLVGSKMRDFFGPRTYQELIRIAESTTADPSAPHVLMPYFDETVKLIENQYGFKISFIRLYSVGPGSKIAEEFIRASTKKYVAEQEALADTAKGEGLAARDKAHYNAIKDIPGAADMYKWDQIAKSNLTTYVEAGGAQPAVVVGGNTQNKPSQTPPPSQPPVTTT